MTFALADPAAALTPLRLTVNGRAVRADAEPRRHLADFLREDLGLTGTHLGCEHGVCGACTVLLDGEPVRSCLSFAVGCEAAHVTTIEGLDEDEIAIELRTAFRREHALQCGYCTPGMLIAARDLVLRLPEADERRIRLGLSGNLCRCTGYVGIVRAITSVIADRRERGVAPVITRRDLGPVGTRVGTETVTPVVAAARVQSAARLGPTKSMSFAQFEPAHTIDQTFVVPFAPHEVFALFGRVEEIAACLPGVRLTGPPDTQRVAGVIAVQLGPISAAFSGEAAIERDPATLSGRIVGAGLDRSGRSSTQGLIRYRVGAGASPGEARIDLTIGYTLKGPLAQFGRPGLVRDLAGRITADFARNIAARLRGEALAPARNLNIASIVASLVTDRLRGWIDRFRRR